MSTQKIDFYKSVIHEPEYDGWGTSHDLFMHNGSIDSEPVIGDRMWSQFYYGLFIAHIEKDEAVKIASVNQFVDATFKMLLDTDGVFIRDVSNAATVAYINENDTGLEASKDQILGLVGALFAMYKSVNHEIVRMRIREVVKIISDHLTKHNWFLYNENEKRSYDSANYCHVHHVGLGVAFDEILGNTRKHSLMDILLNVLTGRSFITYTLRNVVDIKNKKKWWQNIKWLQKYSWYGTYFRAGVYDFNVNLCHMELYILGMSSLRNAKWVLKLLEEPNVMKTNNLNLASLYFRLIDRYTKWNPDPAATSYYSKLCEHNERLHPDNVVPNSTCIGCNWYGQEVLNSHEIYDYDKLVPNINGHVDPSPALVKASMNNKISCSNGLYYLSRKW